MRGKWLNLLVLFTLVLGALPLAAGPGPAAAMSLADEPPVLPEGRTNEKRLELAPVEAEELTVRQRPAAELGEATGPAVYIVQLEAEPLASYRGTITGLRATSPSVTGADRLNLEAEASQDYVDYLSGQRDMVLNRVQREIGRSVAPLHVYEVAYNGMALELTPEEAATVAKVPGVARVTPNFVRYLQTDTTPAFLGATGIWDGTNTGVISGTMGEGIVVGIIDTGINMDHPSFADVGDDGYDHTNPLGEGVYTGWCNPLHDDYDPTLVCNDKLIGVYSYPSSGDSPEDDNSHGSHTASTAAGNILHDVTYDGYTFDQISGMAPHANIIAYDVCTADGCQGDSILAAIDDAVADGVDVINYSIGGGPYDPWADPDSEAYLAARDAGVFVATSAGNDGPDAGTVGSPANSPWMTSVANTTIGRVVANTLDVTGPGTVPAALTDIAAIHGPDGPAIGSDIEAGIVYAGDVDADNVTGCVAFPAGAFTDSIALIQRGGCTFAEKVNFATTAGAIAVVIFNNAGGPPMVMGGLETTTIPAVFITLDDGIAVRDWIQAETDPTARINDELSAVYNEEWADILASGSSRGPNVNADVIKPDIAAPGTNIFAAYAGDATSFGMMSGTSMASPHVAGAGALMSALFPDWTEAEIQSALMMTSDRGVVKEDAETPVDPFDVGAGRLDLTSAALAGLVLDETTENFEAADPAAGGDPTTLNLASLGSGACLQTCTWERTFRNTTDQAVTWEVAFSGGVLLSADPMSFTVPAGATQMVTFSADVSEEAEGVWLFGEVTLTADDAALPPLHLPVAVLPTTGVLPGLVEIETRRNAGSQLVEGLQALEIVDLTVETFGLVQAQLDEISLYEDPTNDDPYDDLNQVYYDLVSVPVGAKRLVVEVTASEAPDVDLFVLYDTGAGFAEVCASATPSWNEVCDLVDPDAGLYLFVVQNWQGSEDQPDTITVATGVVPGTDAENMQVTGPAGVPAGEPFDVRVFWDTAEMVAGDRWYGAFSLGSEPGSEGDVGVVPVTVIRHEDDVVKTASTDFATFGEVFTYTITVAPNVTPVDMTYMLTDTIPAGLTYVPGSAQASHGTVDVVGNELTWTGLMAIPAGGEYVISTSDEDPTCDTGFGGYLDLEGSEIFAQASISGDTVAWTAFTGQDPFNFYGTDNTGIYFTDDGFAGFDIDNNWVLAPEPWTNQNLPDPTLPNNLIAFLWQDMEIVYDEVNNYGVSIATAGTGVSIIEYDDVQVYGDATQTYDVELVYFNGPPVDGYPEFVFAYDNISGDIDANTIGVENEDGTLASQYAYNDAGITLYDGLMICFDWYVPPTDPAVITYQVTAGSPAASPTTNTVVHDTDNPGSKPAEASVDVYIQGYKDASKMVVDAGARFEYTIVVAGGESLRQWQVTDALPEGLTVVDVDGADYDPGTHTLSWSGNLGLDVTTFVDQGFEDTFPPSGWVGVETGATDDPGWELEDVTVHTGSGAAYHDNFDSDGLSISWLVSPKIAVPIHGGTLSFWQYQRMASQYQYHGVWVSTASSDPADFVELTELGAGTQSAWEEKVLDLSDYAGQEIYLAFRYEGDGADEWIIDDVLVTGPVGTASHTITVGVKGVPGTYTNVAVAKAQSDQVTMTAPVVEVGWYKLRLPVIFKNAP